MTLKGERECDLREEETIYPEETTFNPILRAKENSTGKKASSVLVTVITNLKIGTDLTGMSSPIILDRGISSLEINADGQKPTEALFDFMNEGDEKLRALHLTRHLLINFLGFVSLRLERTKPFNPILGEQFFSYWDDQTDDEARFEGILEQVSHHPPITAFHFKNEKKNYASYGSLRTSVIFKGNSIEVQNKGENQIEHTNPSSGVREKYNIDGITAHGVGIIFGSAGFGLTNTTTITCEQTGAVIKLSFSKLHHVKGKIKFPNPSNPKKLTKLYRFSGDMLNQIVLEDMTTKTKTPWLELANLTYYHKKMRTVADQGPLESRRVWHNVRYGILKNDEKLASEQKTIIEEHQRDIRKQRAKDKTKFDPLYFTEQKGSTTKCPNFVINDKGHTKLKSYFSPLDIEDEDLD